MDSVSKPARKEMNHRLYSSIHQVRSLSFIRWGCSPKTSVNPPKIAEGFAGITLAYNVERREEVDVVIEKVCKAGGRIAKEPAETFWGGYHAYFSDLDGYYWEVVWGPMFEYDENGLLKDL